MSKEAPYMMPKQGNKAPWKNYQNYLKDIFAVRLASIDDSNLKFDDYKKQMNEPIEVFIPLMFIFLIVLVIDYLKIIIPNVKHGIRPVLV